MHPTRSKSEPNTIGFGIKKVMPGPVLRNRIRDPDAIPTPKSGIGIDFSGPRIQVPDPTHVLSSYFWVKNTQNI